MTRISLVLVVNTGNLNALTYVSLVRLDSDIGAAPVSALLDTVKSSSSESDASDVGNVEFRLLNESISRVS